MGRNRVGKTVYRLTAAVGRESEPQSIEEYQHQRCHTDRKHWGLRHLARQRVISNCNGTSNGCFPDSNTQGASGSPGGRNARKVTLCRPNYTSAGSTEAVR